MTISSVTYTYGAQYHLFNKNMTFKFLIIFTLGGSASPQVIYSLPMGIDGSRWSGYSYNGGADHREGFRAINSSVSIAAYKPDAGNWSTGSGRELAESGLVFAAV